MDKEATDLLNLALLSLITGGGVYAGARGLKDLSKGPEDEENKNELNITLPAARMPKTAEEDTSIGTYFNPAITGILGLTGGFMGASKLYEHLKKKQLDAEMDKTQKDYMSALQQAHTKVSSCKTPNVDSFLEGLINKAGEELSKTAYVTPEFLNGEGPADLVGHQTKNLFSSFFDSDLGKMTGATMLLSALGSGAATYGIAKKMDNDKEKAKKQTNLPTDVRLSIAK